MLSTHVPPVWRAPWPMSKAERRALAISRSGTRRKQRFFPFPVRGHAGNSVSSVRFDFNNKKNCSPRHQPIKNI